jgi:hypothetical protein
MVFASLETGIIALIVGIALVLIANRIPIQQYVNAALYIIGFILIVLAIVAFLLFFVGIVA